MTGVRARVLASRYIIVQTQYQHPQYCTQRHRAYCIFTQTKCCTPTQKWVFSGCTCSLQLPFFSSLGQVVLDAIKLVDSKRNIKKLEASIEKLQQKKTKAVKKQIKEKTRDLYSLKAEGSLSGSLSGSLTQYLSTFGCFLFVLTTERKMDCHDSS